MEIRHRAFCQRLTAVDRHRLLLLLFVLPPSAYETSQSVSQSANNRTGTRSDASKTHALHSLLSHVTLTLPQSLAITRGVLPAEQHRRKTTFIHDPAKSHHAPVSCLLLPLPLHHFSGRNGAPLKNWIQIKVDVNFISRSPLYPSPSATTPLIHFIFRCTSHVWHIYNSEDGSQHLVRSTIPTNWPTMISKFRNLPLGSFKIFRSLPWSSSSCDDAIPNYYYYLLAYQFCNGLSI